jgi:Putative restriction endonuclease
MVQEEHRAATYDDLLAVPEPLVAEILHGRLVTHPRPVPRHAFAAAALGSVLGSPFQFGDGGPGGWLFMAESELHFETHVAVPDLAGWRRETLPVLPETAWIETPPDWICETLSPSTERYDRGDKRKLYAAVGVAHFWLVDPRSQILEAFELADHKWQLAGVFSGSTDVRAVPFQAISFPSSRLWPFEATAPSA